MGLIDCYADNQQKKPSREGYAFMLSQGHRGLYTQYGAGTPKKLVKISLLSPRHKIQQLLLSARLSSPALPEPTAFGFLFRYVVRAA